MKSCPNPLFIAVVLPTALLLSTGCGESAEAREVRKETNEALDATANYTRKEIQEMKSQLKERWSELETEVKKLKAEASARGASANAEVAKIVADVEAKAKAARGKLESVAEAGSDEAGKSLTHLGEAYESAKKAVQDAWQALRK